MSGQRPTHCVPVPSGSLQVSLGLLRMNFKRKTDKRYIKCVPPGPALRTGSADTLQWIRESLSREGVVVNIKKPKHLFTETDLVRFNTTFWTVDDSTFVHPRNRAQIPFLIAVYCWTGARIGAFFNGPGLRYKVKNQSV